MFKNKKLNNFFDVIIVGAGVPGGLLALKCARLGLTVAVIEKESYTNIANAKGCNEIKKTNGRSVALMKAACDELRQVGVFDTVQGISTPLKSLRIIDDSFFPEDNHIDHLYHAHEIGENEFGYNIPLNSLIDSMRNALQENENIVFYHSAEIQDIVFEQDYVDVSLKCADVDGRKVLQNGVKESGADNSIAPSLSLNAKLIVAADGRDSITRSFTPIHVETKPYRTTALTCVIQHEISHENVSTEFHRSGGPFTLVPMNGNMSSVVWCENEDDAAQFLSMSAAQQEQALQERSCDILGNISLQSDLHAWPIISLKAQKFMTDRCALIAEAAHVLSPIGAQGMNLSLRDVGGLYDVVREAALNGLDIGSDVTLTKYQNARRDDVVKRIVGVDLFHRVVNTNNPVMHKLRRSLFNALSLYTPIREMLMKEGLRPKIGTIAR